MRTLSLGDFLSPAAATGCKQRHKAGKTQCMACSAPGWGGGGATWTAFHAFYLSFFVANKLQERSLGGGNKIRPSVHAHKCAADGVSRSLAGPWLHLAGGSAVTNIIHSACRTGCSEPRESRRIKFSQYANLHAPDMHGRTKRPPQEEGKNTSRDTSIPIATAVLH